MSDTKSKPRKPRIEYEDALFGGRKVKIAQDERVPNLYPLPERYIRGIIVGRSGTGKTTLLLDLLARFGNLSAVACFSKVESPVYEAIEAQCNDQGIWYRFASSPVEAQEAIEEMLDKPEGTQSLTIFDDFSRADTGRNDPYNRVADAAYRKLRNFGNSSIYISQDWYSVPVAVRANPNMVVSFRLNGKRNISGMLDDLSNMTGISVEDLMEPYKQVRAEEHGWMMATDREIILRLPERLPDTVQGRHRLLIQPISEVVD